MPTPTKILAALLLGILLFGFTACNRESFGIEKDTSLTTEATTTAPRDERISTAMQAYRAVLLKEATFYCTSRSIGVSEDIGFGAEVLIGEQMGDFGVLALTKFTAVDMDRDGVPEIVVEYGYPDGNLVLHYDKGKVYGYIIGIRSMLGLKIDGTFYGSGGAENLYISEMRFLSDSFDINSTAHSNDATGHGFYSCYVRDMMTDKDTFDKFKLSYENTPDAVWYEFTKEEITRRLIDESAALETPPMSEKTAAEKQEYLNSLAYVFEFSYYNSNYESQDEINAKLLKYYNSWKDELDKIYQLYAGKLSGGELEALAAGQREWKELYGQIEFVISNGWIIVRDNKFDFYDITYITKNRTYMLIDLYFRD